MHQEKVAAEFQRITGGCHQLRDGFGLRGATTVNYDMTFNTILLNAIAGDVLDFEGTTKKICVLQRSQADSELMRAMAAYTLILTKWELFDDKTDKPSVKTNIISSVLKNAIDKAVDEQYSVVGGCFYAQAFYGCLVICAVHNNGGGDTLDSEPVYERTKLAHRVAVVAVCHYNGFVLLF